MMLKLYNFQKINLKKIKKSLNDPSLSLVELEKVWLKYFYQNTKNGKLLLKNSYNDDLSNKKFIDFLHITPSIDRIEESKKIFPSSGGLGYAVYCSALHKDGKPHNISDLYINYQLKIKHKKKIEPLLIRVYLNNKASKNIKESGIDYTLFGKINLIAWSKINNKKKEIIQNNILLRLKKEEKRINNIIKKEYENEEVFSKEVDYFFRDFKELRNILYEVVAEFILFFQEDKIIKSFREKRREILNIYHKKIIFKLCPRMKRKFRMNYFDINLIKLLNILKKHRAFKNINSDDYWYFMRNRFSYYFRKLIAYEEIKVKGNDSFEKIQKKYPFFIGQIVYRADENLKKEIELIRARILMKILKKDGIFLLIYSLIPKGEMGIAPSINSIGLRYEIFKCKYNGLEKPILIREKINIKIGNELSSEKMRSIR